MSNDALVTRANGSTITESWYDLFRQVLSGDMYPRNGSGVATDLAGSLGSPTYKWRRGFAASGEFFVGAIKFFNSYDGLLSPGQGWMLMDGRIVNQANYDDEHGDGMWAIHVVSSPINGRYLPDMTGRQLSGAAAVAQDGLSAFVAEGIPANTMDLRHLHQWYKKIASTSLPDQYYNSAGSAIDLGDPGTTKSGSGKGIVRSNAFSTGFGVDLYTDKQLNANVSTQAEGNEAMHYMRII